MEKKEEKELPEIPEFPSITPDMLKYTLHLLEREGMVFYWGGKAYIPTQRGWRLLTEIKPVEEEIIAYGSSNIKAESDTSISLVKGDEIDESVIGIKANKSAKELSEEMKIALKAARKVRVTIRVGGYEDVFEACGSPALEMSDDGKITIRKDDEIDESVVCIVADKAAKDLKEEILQEIRKDGNEIRVILEALP